MNNKDESSMEQAILDAAEKLFLEKGFAATSTTQIAKLVGCNQALVHYYYRTKENLFNTILEKKFRLLFSAMFGSEDLGDLSFEEKLKQVVRSHFDMLTQNPQIPLLVFTELARMPANIETLREKLKHIPMAVYMEVSRELNAEIEAGRIRKLELLDIVLTMVAQNAGFFIMLPMISGLLQLDDSQRQELIAHRREENVQAVINFIKP